MIYTMHTTIVFSQAYNLLVVFLGEFYTNILMLSTHHVGNPIINIPKSPSVEKICWHQPPTILCLWHWIILNTITAEIICFFHNIIIITTIIIFCIFIDYDIMYLCSSIYIYTFPKIGLPQISIEEATACPEISKHGLERATADAGLELLEGVDVK